MVKPREELWRLISDVYEGILEHPFIQGLVSGALPMETFKDYVIQDALYLSQFARAVALVGVKAPDDDSATILLTSALDALTVERASLHEFLLSEWGMNLEKIYDTPMNMTDTAYTNYLTAVAYSRPFHEGIAAILPCFWVYWEVGKHLLEHGSPNEAYRRWIDTYSSKEYARAVERVIRLTEETYTKVGEEEKKAMKRHFRTSTIYEYLFWDAAYKHEEWPFKP
ncbi:MAG: thiaminase II [Aigarchaeota archaeon]|nr:thiaminase II [Candidatus Pelearchaeum maunauluense]